MTEAERMAGLIREALPHRKRGSLRIWGAWFGRPGDNLHQIVDCHADADLLTVQFDKGEFLRVWSPNAVTIDEDIVRIGDAKRVRWEWFEYGQPRTPANLYYEDFTEDGRKETNVFGSFSSDRSQPAVEIR